MTLWSPRTWHYQGTRSVGTCEAREDKERTVSFWFVSKEGQHRRIYKESRLNLSLGKRSGGERPGGKSPVTVQAHL